MNIFQEFRHVTRATCTCVIEIGKKPLPVNCIGQETGEVDTAFMIAIAAETITCGAFC